VPPKLGFGGGARREYRKLGSWLKLPKEEK
jgi:hypothetical protein